MVLILCLVAFHPDKLGPSTRCKPLKREISPSLMVGFRIAGHIVFRKQYASSVRFMRYQHEQAYLLAKGNPRPPAQPVRRNRLCLYWQPTASHAEAQRGAFASHRGFLQAVRHCP
jgi:hypothetical protein